MKAFEEAQEILEGFTISDAEIVTAVYVCAQCEGALVIVPFLFDQESVERWSVICPDCGDVEQVGRISKTTVAIRNERGIWDYPKAIRALSDLWGELIEHNQTKILSELGF